MAVRGIERVARAVIDYLSGDLMPALHSHQYEEGLVLLQVNGELPKQEADRYGGVLENKV